MTTSDWVFEEKVHKFKNGILYVGEVNKQGISNGYGIAISAKGDEIIESYFENSKLFGYSRTLKIKKDGSLVVCEGHF